MAPLSVRSSVRSRTRRQNAHLFGNSLLFGLPQYQIQKLQRVQNASARLVFAMPRYCHITPLLLDLHCMVTSKPATYCWVIHTYIIDHCPLGLFRANETNNSNELNRLRIPTGRRQYFINQLQVIQLILSQWCAVRLTTLGVTTMVSYSVTFLPILRKLWVIVHFRVSRLNYGTIFLLKLGVPILLYLLNRSLRHFYLRKLFNDILLFLCLYLFIYCI